MKPWPRRCCRALSVVALLYLLAAVGCASFQRKMLYFPFTASVEDMEAAGAASGLQRWKNAAGENIGWKRNAPRAPVGQILITHGNGARAIDRANFAEALRTSEGMDVFILEYPGYGDRGGTPSEKSFFAAGEEAFQSLPKGVPIYLLGESLGTGVASHLAGDHPDVSGVLLVAPYNRLADVAQYHLRIFPARWLLRDHYESEKHLAHYHGPLAIWIGGRDTIVPAKFGRRLFDRYSGPKRLWEAPHAGHNEIHDACGEYWPEVVEFWRSHPPR